MSEKKSGITKGQIAELLAQDKDGRITREMMDAFLRDPGWMLRRFDHMVVDLNPGGVTVSCSVSETVKGYTVHRKLSQLSPGADKVWLSLPVGSERPSKRFAMEFVCLAELLTGALFIKGGESATHVLFVRKEDTASE